MDTISSLFKVFTSYNSNNIMNAESKRQVITRLKFIGQLSAGEKIDINSLTVESSNIFTPIKRLISGSSRDATLHFCSSTIERTFEIIEANLHSEKKADKIFVANTINDLINAVKGMRAIQSTYTNDKITVCSIETQIESIQAFVMELQEKHPDLLKLKDAYMINLEKSCKSKTEDKSINMSLDVPDEEEDN